MLKRHGKVVRLGLIGSIVFGCVLILAGYLFKKYVGGIESLSEKDALTVNRAGLGIMIVGAVIAIGNVLWISFMIIMVIRENRKSR